MPLWVSPLLNNFAATAAPAATDDSSKGYSVGSFWLNTTTGRLFELKVATASAAVWQAVTVDNAGYKTADYALPLGMSSLTNRVPSTSATVVAWPFFVPRSVTIDRAGVNLVTGQVGAACRIGAYMEDGAGRPGVLIADWGELDLSGGAADVLATVSTLVSGFFWVLVWMKNVATQATLVGPNVNTAGAQPALAASVACRCGLNATTAYPGSMPDPAPAVSTAGWSSLYPVAQLRFA